jgi:hypothetical protein
MIWVSSTHSPTPARAAGWSRTISARTGVATAGIALDELEAVVDLWADAALRLSEGDLKLMRRLVAAQTRLLDKPKG